MPDTVTIGIPTYNQELYIRETIEGCLHQNYPHLRIIVADDRSTDGTSNIAKSYSHDTRISYKLNEKNFGRVGNYRHLLYNYAASAWYVNLDGDDYFTDPDFIANAMHFIGKYSSDEIAFYQGNHDLDKLKKILPKYEVLSEYEIITEGKDYFLHFPRIRRFTHCATVYNRGKAIKLDFYNFNCLFTDFNSMSRLSMTGKVILSSRNVAVWRQHSGNESKSLNEQNLQNELASLEAVAQFARLHLDSVQTDKWLKEMKDYYHLIFIYHNTKHYPGWKTLGFIFRHWRFDLLYPRYVFKNLLLMSGLLKR
jgi:glycosyltransferase involved in cell wall biosynthesis